MPIFRRPNLCAIAGALAVALVAGAATVQSDSQPTTLPATAPSFQPAVDPAASRELMAGLASVDAHVRQRSENSLVRMGEDARPLLAELLQHSQDLEVTTRAEAAIRRIDENRLYGPSYVTLHLKNVEPSLAVAELSRQAFAPLPVFPDNLLDQGGLPKVSIDLDREPFWVAMQQFSQQTGLELQQYNETVRLMRGAMRAAGPTYISGPFLIVANQISRTQTIQLGAGGGPIAMQSDFTLNLFAFSEPKLKVVRSGSSVQLEEAVDDHGNSLIPVGPDNRGFYGGGGGGCWQLFCRLGWPHNAGRRIKSLKGRTSFTVQTKSQTIRIDNLVSVKDKAEVVNGVPLTVRSFSKSDGGWELKLSITPDPQNPMGWIQLQQSMMNKLTIVDAQGTALDHRGMSSRGINNDIELNLQFAQSNRPDGRSGEPLKLLWEFPLETKDLTVSFKFADIPMPGDQ